MSDIKDLEEKLAKVEREKKRIYEQLLYCMCAPAHDICTKYHLQNCNICQDVYCGDNTNPLIKELKDLRLMKLKGE